MKHGFSLLAIVAATCLLSCAKENSEPKTGPVQPGTVRLNISASAELPRTRTMVRVMASTGPILYFL